MRNLREKGDEMNFIEAATEERSHMTAHAMPGRLVVLYCGHCEGAYRFSLPSTLSDVLAVMDHFSERHQECKQGDAHARKS